MSKKVNRKNASPSGGFKNEKPKEFKKTLLRLLSYLKPRKYALIFVTIAALFATVFNVISPKVL